jgi:dTDP-4-amino-4,6-dideoxygalactose transaminase
MIKAAKSISAGPVAARRPSVPVFDARTHTAKLREEILAALGEVVDTAGFVLGPSVEKFEEDFARYTGAKYCVAVNSGTSALHLALLAAGVGPGDEVITVPMTFVATSWAISYVGATPVYVDVDPITYTMDVTQVSERITPRTKAILPVHLYGQPADMGALAEISNRHGIPVIEDSAQAHGAYYYERHAGTMGLCGCFSFYPAKNLGACGEGGAIVTSSSESARRMRALRDHAQEQRYHHDELGFNYRMDGFQGAVLNVKLKYLERWLESRRFLAERYQKLLASLDVQLPVQAPGCRHAWHLFVILHRRRDQIRQALEASGVQTGLHYPIPVHLQKAYERLGHARGDFPMAERIGEECLTLPLYPEMTIGQQDTVIASLTDAMQEIEWR